MSSYFSKEAIKRIRKNIKDENVLLEFIEGEFKRAESKIQRDILYYLERIADNNGKLSLVEAKKLLNKDELSSFHMSLREYIRKGSGILDDQTIKDLENASNRVHISRLQAIEHEVKKITSELFTAYQRGTRELLEASYKDNFHHILYDLQDFSGEYKHISAIDPRRIEALFTSEWAMDRVPLSKRFGINQHRLNEELRRELYQTIISTQEIDKAISNISDRMGIGMRAASRLIQTEHAAIASQADKDAYKEFGQKQYQILATLDNRTSMKCRGMDGKIFDTKDHEVGITAPPFHAYCRTTTIPYFADEDDQRIARDKNGKNVMVSSKLSYREWEKKYVG